MSSAKQPAAAGGSGVGPNRRKWDVDEYASKARERDREERERAQENDERLRKGQQPLKRRRRDDLPAPTQEMQARTGDLGLAKNEGKTLMVENVAGGRKGPGFYCQECKRTFKDSIAYLDHVNGRMHLRQLGQTTHVARSSLEDVRARLQYWTKELHERKSGSREYDFAKRLEEIADKQRAEKEQRKQRRREEKAAKSGQGAAQADADAVAMMGFGNFGSTKRR